MNSSTTNLVDQASPRWQDQPIALGVTGLPCRASVSAWGDVTAYLDSGATPTLKWHVAADDRWHVPSDEAAVRQHRIDGTPVVETRLRVPDGDAVQRVWSVADHGGLTIIEVENESPLPFAVAFSGLEVLTERPVADVPVQGIDLPADAIVLPVGHHASIRVAIAHGPAPSPSGQLQPVAGALAVARGWLTVAHGASRLVLPDSGLVDSVVSARCDLLLNGPVNPEADTVGFLFDVAELGRLGDNADAWMPEIVEPVARIARTDTPETDAALRACERLAVLADDDRAAGDIKRLLRRRQRDFERKGATKGAQLSSFSEVRRGASAGRFVFEVERLLASGSELLPVGIPRSWFGVNFEVHGIPTGDRSTVSYAVRWHGDRPAVLWEQHGGSRLLKAPAVDPDWSSAESSGEALWAAPPRPKTIAVSADPDER